MLKSNSEGYLALVFESKLNWMSHIQPLKSKRNKTLSMMQFLSSTSWGLPQKNSIDYLQNTEEIQTGTRMLSI